MSRWRRAPREVARAYNGPMFSLQDPALADYLGIGGHNDAGVSVNEKTALGLTAVYRAVSLTASTLAGLPLKTYRDNAPDVPGGRVQVASVFDNPGGLFYTPFEFKQIMFTHLLLHGNAYLLHIYSGAGTLVALFPIHPMMVTPELAPDGQSRQYKVTGTDGVTKIYTDADLTHVMGPSTDGLQGLSPIRVARNALGTAIAADKAAARMFSSGLLIGGIVTSDETLDENDAATILAGLKAKLTGTQNAGDIAIVNASLKFQPWTMNAEDAQFIESRQYQVAEVARLFGTPVQLLAQDGASSWGSGIQELVRGWQKFTLTAWTTPAEERFSRLLADTRFCEFEYQGLNQGSPAEEIALLVQQVQTGILTIDEARAIRNMPPLPTGSGTAPATPVTEGDSSGSPQ